MENAVRILVVDDDPDLLAATARLVKRAGYIVFEAADGRAGLDLARSSQPDLLLLDVDLPDISGLDVCQQIKSDPALAHSFVVLLSAKHTTSDEQSLGLEVGADGYIARPIANRELIARIQSYVRLQQTEARLRQSEARLRIIVEEKERLIGELETVLREVKTLTGLIPICAGCKNIRDDDGYWSRVETYIGQRSGAQFTHGLCPKCVQKYYPDIDDEPEKEVAKQGVARGVDAAPAQTSAEGETEALLEREEHYRLLEENASDVIWLLDVESDTLRYVSPSVERLRGYTAEEVMRQGLSAALTPASLEYLRSVVPERLERFREGRIEYFSDELEQLHKNGSTVWTEVRARYITNRTSGRIEAIGVTRDITERKRAQELLRQSEAKFRRLYENSPLGIYQTTPDGRILLANPALLAMLGYDSWEALARRNLESSGFLPQHPRRHFKDAIQRTGAVTGLESVWQNADGSPIAVRESAQIVRGGDGEILYYDGVVEDITADKQREAAQRESEQRYRLLAENTLDVIWLMSPKMVFTYVNPAIHAMTGWTPEEWVGSALSDHCDPAHLPTCTHAIEAALKRLPESSGITFETEMRRKNGTSIAVEITGKLLLDEQGRLQGLQGTTRDITERKRNEVALRASEAKHRTLLENIPQKVFLKDRNFRWVSVNERFAGDLGVPPAQVEGKEDSDFFPKDLAAKYRADDQRIMKTGLTEEFDEEYSLGEERRYVHTIKSPVRDATGEIIGIMCVFSDVTERKIAEQAIHESAEQLRKAIEEAPIPIMLHDERDHILYLSRGWTDFSGYTKEDIPGFADWTERAFGRRSGFEKEMIDTLFEHNRTVDNGERTVRAKDGTKRIWTFQTTPLGHFGRGRCLLLSLSVDITERKQAEEALAKERTMLRTLLNHLPVGVYAKDVQGRKTLVNPCEVRNMGLASEEEALGKTDLDVYQREDALAFMERDRQVMDSRQPVLDREEWVTRPGGDRVCMITSKMPLIDHAGEVMGLVGISVDITERKQAEFALRESEERFRLMVEGSNQVFFYRHDPENLFEYVSPSVREVLGYEAAELIGRSYEVLLTDEARNQFVHEQTNVALTKGDRCPAYHAYARRKDGNRIVLEIVETPIRRDDRVVGIQGIARDVTDQVAAEERLRCEEARFRSLSEVLQHLGPTTQDVLDFTLDHAIRLTGSRIGCVYLYHEDRQQLELSTRSKNFLAEADVLPPNTFHPLDQAGAWGEAVRQRNPIRVNDAQLENAKKSSAQEVRFGCHNCLILPVIRGNGVVAVVGVANKEGDYSELEVDQLRLLMNAGWQVVERRDAEEKLNESEARFRRAIEEAPVPMMLHDETGCVLQLSKGWTRYSGYTRADLPTLMDWTERAYGRLAGAEISYIDKLFDIQETTANGEWPVTARDGSKRIWDFQTTPLGRLSQGNRVLLSLAVDITERKSAENALEESRRFLADLIDNSGALIYAKDRDGCYQLVNRKWEEITGFAREAALGQTDEELFPARDARQFRANDVAVMEAGTALAKEESLSDNQGERAFLSVKFPLRDNDGNISGVCGMTTEITERKRAEAKVVALSQNLEQRVAERTAELEEANRELEGFSYSVSHDLRAPLRAINGYAEILLEDYAGHLDAEARRLLKIISSSGRHMGKLIDALLDFSRLGRRPMHFQSVNMTTLAKEVFGELNELEGTPNLDLDLRVLPDVLGDPILLRQVWRNVLANAIKFTRHVAQPRLEISAHSSGSEIIYSAKDNGAGFDMQYADKLFRVFQRLHSRSEYEGHGVGLALCHRIITRHRGRMWAEGAVDKGATIYFALPKK